MKRVPLISFLAVSVAVALGANVASAANETTTTPPPRLFAAAAFTKAQKDSSIPTDAGTFVRADDGTWHSFGPKIQQVSSATVAPSDPNLIFLACGNGIERSRDGGATWRQVTGWEISDVIAIEVDPTDANHVYAASAWGMWRSADGGDTWLRADTGIDPKDAFTRTIVLDAQNPARLLAGTSGGLYVSADHGATWERVKAVPAVNILRVRRGVSDSSIWVLGTEGRGAWLSFDDAATWHAVAPALANANVYGVAVDPTNAKRLAVGGWQTGVHVSTDGGLTWLARTTGLPSLNLLALAFDPTHSGRLWVSTFEEGTVFSDDAGVTWRDGGLYGALVSDLGFLPLPVLP